MPEMACQIFLNAKNARMDEMKSSIRKFLALTKMTRDEFANLCGVSKSQVDKWLSTVPIPRARQRLIIRIMKEEYAKHARLVQTKNPNSIYVPVTPQKYEKFRNEAERHGLTVPEWASEAWMLFPASRAKVKSRVHYPGTVPRKEKIAFQTLPSYFFFHHITCINSCLTTIYAPWSRNGCNAKNASPTNWRRK